LLYWPAVTKPASRDEELCHHWEALKMAAKEKDLVHGASGARCPVGMWSAKRGVMQAIGAIRRCNGRTIVNEAIAAKALIVLGAFPVIAHASFTGMTMLGDAVLGSVLELVGGWSELLSTGVTVASFLLAVRLAFVVCRRLWPVGA
jgi:hypothetical protein